MANTTTSPNMSLPIPVVGTDPGPDYADNINSCMSLIDSHNHTTGNGAPVPTSGININADLPFGSFNATGLRSVRFNAQASTLSGASDLGCIYVSGVDLYYNDENGNKIRITSGGAVAGTPGSISNLASPASASYVSASGTFVFQQNTNTAANMDVASIILRNATSGSYGITISPPSGLAANYSLTLPGALPSQQNIMTMDNSGNIAAAWNVDNSTLQVSSNVMSIKNQGVTQATLATRATGSTVAAGGVASASFSWSTLTTATTLSASEITITTTGRPVMIILAPNGSETDATIRCTTSTWTELGLILSILNTTSGTTPGTMVYFASLPSGGTGNENQDMNFAPSLVVMDFPAAGTYTYALNVSGVAKDAGVNQSYSTTGNNFTLYAYET